MRTPWAPLTDGTTVRDRPAKREATRALFFALAYNNPTKKSLLLRARVERSRGLGKHIFLVPLTLTYKIKYLDEESVIVIKIFAKNWNNRIGLSMTKFLINLFSFVSPEFPGSPSPASMFFVVTHYLPVRAVPWDGRTPRKRAARKEKKTKRDDPRPNKGVLCVTQSQWVKLANSVRQDFTTIWARQTLNIYIFHNWLGISSN